MSEPVELVLPSNRQFGLVFVVFFALLAGVSLWRGGTWYPGLIAASAAVAFVTLAAPASLTPLNRKWMQLAALLHRIFSPIILGLMFFAIITPVAMFMRLIGRDEMRRRWEPAATSYWVPRKPPGPAPGSLDEQF
jgi:Saxitoxin biosynthesis operon protein SxtJ